MVKTYVFTSPDWDVTLATNSSISEQIRIKNYLRNFFITAGSALCEVFGLGMLLVYSYWRVFHNAARWINCNKAYRKTKNVNDNSRN